MIAWLSCLVSLRFSRDVGVAVRRWRALSSWKARKAAGRLGQRRVGAAVGPASILTVATIIPSLLASQDNKN